jgi:hypothetical protein
VRAHPSDKKRSSNKTLLASAAIRPTQNAIFDPRQCHLIKRSFANYASDELIVRLRLVDISSTWPQTTKTSGLVIADHKEKAPARAKPKGALRRTDLPHLHLWRSTVSNSHAEKGWKILLFERLALFL